MKQGKIFVIEGTDCSGKATQTNLLLDRLRLENIPCEKLSFPRYNTPTGNIIKRYLGKDGYQQEFGPAVDVPPKIASVLYAEDRYAAKPEILEIINSGKNLIFDRWVEANMGHQGGKIVKENREEFFRWVNELEYGTFNLPRPDSILFLYMPYQVGIKLKKGRPGEADGHESSIDHLRNAEDAYIQLANMFSWKRINCTKDGTIATLRTPEDISNEVYKNVIEAINKG
jgi:dTMP kinase